MIPGRRRALFRPHRLRRCRRLVLQAKQIQRQHMSAPEGHSKAVSTDVADTVEGLMPTLMDIFCGGDEVVRFERITTVAN
jgi:hypothetical protein